MRGAVKEKENTQRVTTEPSQSLETEKEFAIEKQPILPLVRERKATLQ